MAFPHSPAQGDYHHEGSSSFIYKGDIWIKLAEEQRVGTIVHSLLSEAEFNQDMTDEYKGQWVLADGRDITGSRLAAITGSTTVVDLRGAFLRMAGQNTDPAWTGPTLRSYQQDATRMPHIPFTAANGGNHQHQAALRQLTSGWSGDSPMKFFTNGADPQGTDDGPANTSISGDHSHTINGGDLETRPKNYGINYFVKIN